VKTPEAIVFVIDDDVSAREALTSLIRSDGLHVEAFASARDFLARKRPAGPSCLVLDVHMPELNGLKLQKQLNDLGREIPIIFITGQGDIPMTVQAMKAGAVEFLVKPFVDQNLLDAVRSALKKNEEGLTEQVQLQTLRARYQSLTPREREVMERVVTGLLNNQIAGELGTSEITVKVHRSQVMQKMKAQSLAELVKMSEKLRKNSRNPHQTGRSRDLYQSIID